MAYSHDANSAANLLASQNFNADAEQAYRTAIQLWPASADATQGLAQVLASTGRTQEAQQVLDNFAANYPQQQNTMQPARATITLPGKGN
jgi:thioredoxin-like negative regulator of GroEL